MLDVKTFTVKVHVALSISYHNFNRFRPSFINYIKGMFW